MRCRPYLHRAVLLALLSTTIALTLQSAPLIFSGTVAGTAGEDFSGRCAPLITVNAAGSGSSNLLGAFVDTQSHCDSSFTTFNNGLFTLTSQTSPTESLSGTYSGSALIGAGGALNFSAVLAVTGGSGQFTGASGTLISTGSLNPSGGFQASFSGQVETVPEPSTLLLLPLGSAAIWFVRCKRRRTVPSDR